MVITLSCQVGNGAESGTGFFVAIPVPPRQQSFVYLVTNRHVAECWDPEHHAHPVTSIRVLANTTNGSVTTALENTNGNAPWVFPEDGSVDLAVTPVALPPDLDVLSIPFDMFAIRNSFRQHRLGEGSKVVVTGLFVQFPGDHKFQPILRQGTLSMIPDEPIKTTTGELGTLYLADVHVFGGNSGSPVMAEAQDDLYQMGKRWFIGVVSGYYFEGAESKMEIATTVKGATNANSGVAMIVPADEVKKLIENNPVLKASRDNYFKALPK